MTSSIDIHEASPTRPIYAKQEPGFRRFYAQGSLIHNDEADPEILKIAFWSQKTDVEMEDGVQGTGYSVEAEAVLTWAAAERLGALIEKWLTERRPSEKTDEA